MKKSGTKDTIPAPIVFAMAVGGVPAGKALLDGVGLPMVAGFALFGAALGYFLCRYLLGKMGLPTITTMSELYAARKNRHDV